jgi:hypothetical protein
MKRARAAAAALFFACAAGVFAQERPPSQQPPTVPPGLKTGNPTPGTPQPDPPNLANRITLVGCVQKADDTRAGLPRAESSGADPNTPSDTRFVLTRADRKNIVPPGTGTAVAAIPIAGDTYRLRAIDSQLSPFVGTRVEMSGEVQLAATPSSTDGRAAPLIVDVQVVQKIAASCS